MKKTSILAFLCFSSAIYAMDYWPTGKNWLPLKIQQETCVPITNEDGKLIEEELNAIQPFDYNMAYEGQRWPSSEEAEQYRKNKQIFMRNNYDRKLLIAEKIFKLKAHLVSDYWCIKLLASMPDINYDLKFFNCEGKAKCNETDARPILIEIYNIFLSLGLNRDALSWPHSEFSLDLARDIIDHSIKTEEAYIAKENLLNKLKFEQIKMADDIFYGIAFGGRLDFTIYRKSTIKQS